MRVTPRAAVKLRKRVALSYSAAPLPVLRYQEILHSIHLTRKAKLGLRTCDGYSELLKYLRSDITEVASRLQKGGLGYLDDKTDVEDQVTALSGNANVRSLKLRGFLNNNPRPPSVHS